LLEWFKIQGRHPDIEYVSIRISEFNSGHLKWFDISVSYDGTTLWKQWSKKSFKCVLLSINESIQKEIKELKIKKIIT
jgi:hypothetical protein